MNHEEQKTSRFLTSLSWLLRHWRATSLTLLLALLTFVGWRLYHIIQEDGALIAVEHNEAIERTPEEIRVLKDIKQWECLSVETEELIERHEPHTFGDKHLVKVFKGRLSIGINMEKAADDWFTVDSTACATGGRPSAVLHLPDVELLDEEFIDEARTTTFFEKGVFSPKVKQELYEEAARAMKARTLTPDNLEAARKAAEDQFVRIFQSLGFSPVAVEFGRAEDAPSDKIPAKAS